MSKVQIFIAPDAQVRHVHNDALTPVTSKLGATSVRRATNVEPYADLSTDAKSWLQVRDVVIPDTVSWFADMLLIGGDVLGPFATRDQALEAELSALSEMRAPHAQHHEDQ